MNEPVEQPINGALDLHTFQPSDVKDLVPEYLTACRERGILRVRIIHGKGTGTLKRMVQSILKKLPYVESFRTAEEEGGGWGATIVELRKLTEVCNCPCHTSPHIVHVVPCCTRCPHCRQKISNYFFTEHVGRCEEKKKAG
jgi:Smr domain